MILALATACAAPPALQFVEDPPGRSDVALPLVVAVHGLGDRPESLLALVKSCGLAVRVVAPRGPAPRGDGFSWFDRAEAGGWDVGGISRSADQLAELIGSLQSTRSVVGEPVITGFSQGGILSLAVATRHPGAIGAAISIGGLLPEALLPGAPPADAPSILELHGATDPVIPLEGARSTVAHLAEGRWDAALVTFDAEHQVTPAMRRRLCDELAQQAGRAAPR